jgi:uncharacterized protein involved in exopolysaccharide biosynthesis
MRKIKEEEQEQAFKLDVTEYLRLIWRKKLLVTLPLILSVVVAYVGAKFLPPVYKSSTVLRVENPDVMNIDIQRAAQSRLHRQRVFGPAFAFPGFR